ncbi:hypothetical protein Tco_0920813 [Tanacetum coccineum]
MGDEDLNFIPNKELDKEDLIPIPRESKIGKECDFPLCDDFQSFKTFSNPFFEKKDGFPSRNDESILKEEVHKETLKSYLNPLFEDDEEIISIEVSRQISPKVNSEPSKEFVLDDMSFSPKELNLESLPKDDFDNDDDLFEMDSNNDEWKRICYRVLALRWTLLVIPLSPQVSLCKYSPICHKSLFFIMNVIFTKELNLEFLYKR